MPIFALGTRADLREHIRGDKKDYPRDTSGIRAQRGQKEELATDEREPRPERAAPRSPLPVDERCVACHISEHPLVEKALTM